MTRYFFLLLMAPHRSAISAILYRAKQKCRHGTDQTRTVTLSSRKANKRNCSLVRMRVMRKHDRTVNLPAATAELSDDGLLFNAQVRSGLLVRDVPPLFISSHENC